MPHCYPQAGRVTALDGAPDHPNSEQFIKPGEFDQRGVALQLRNWLSACSIRRRRSNDYT